MFLDGLLLAVLAISVYTDLKSRKIYNKLIYPVLILGFIFHLIQGGWEGLAFSIAGFFMGAFILIIPFFLGGIGAGDVKLLALVGALKGWVFVIYTGIYMSLIGGVIALFLILFGKGMIQKLFIYLVGLRNKQNMPYVFNQQKTYPYGVAIAGGAILTLFLEGRVVVW
ncbi:A24 family peptidase [Neobacillus kokaensis]|uniref:Type 4 prepilin peptidase 1 n=1 Tax=Neobacillus kokaensis TaxID=2759023 RepID=A0ABQ3MYJ4_9BACI|nr:prepilin peptidase [Neobacillus kokaensis]GHH96690.1 type 4 prepilin peptidase 1 [Neobacillus kokaensis]